MISKLSRYMDPATTKSGPYDSFEKSSQMPIAGCTSTPPIAPPNPPKPTTDPTAADRSHIRGQINSHQRRTYVEQVHVIFRLQKSGNPKQIKPPHRIRQKFYRDKRPSGTPAQHRAIRNLAQRRFLIR